MEWLKNHRYLLLIEGILLTILGFLAIALPVVSTLSIELMIGWILIFTGIVQLYRTFISRHLPGVAGFIGSLLMGLLYLIFGVLLLIFPIAGILSLTILITAFFILEGITKIILGFQWRHSKHWVWLIVNGLIALILAYIIWSGWPGTAFWVIGLLVGINMIFFGFSLIFLSLSLPKGPISPSVK